MSRAVEMLGGGVLGFIAGTLLCTPLIAHVFRPVTVTWDASTCPPGIYTITSTATSLTDARSFTAVTQHVRLPKASIVQEFDNLPSGQFQVTAVVRDLRGRSFGSGVQTVFGTGASRGRWVTPTYTAHRAVPRAVTPSAPVAAQPATTQSIAPEFAAAVSPPAIPLSQLVTKIRDQVLAADGAQQLLAASPRWRTIEILDTDADGEADTVRIEWVSGEVFTGWIR